MNHELKTDPETFQDVYNGLKTFEIRKNDRDYCVGDTLTLKETVNTGEQMKSGLPLVYTGRKIQADVIHILYGPIYGLKKDWCIMSINPAFKGARLK